MGGRAKTERAGAPGGVRVALVLVIVALAFIAVKLSTPTRPGTPPADVVLPNPLNVRIAELKLAKVPLGEAIGIVQQKAGVPIDVRWEQLADRGILAETPVDADLRDVALYPILRTLFAHAIHGQPPDVGRGRGEGLPLQFDVSGNTITITDWDDVSLALITRVYDVRDLLSEAYSRADSHRRFSEEGAASPELDLEYVIYQCLPREERSAFPTQVGKRTIMSFGGRLVVIDVASNHLIVESALRELRRAR